MALILLHRSSFLRSDVSKKQLIRIEVGQIESASHAALDNTPGLADNFTMATIAIDAIAKRLELHG